MKHAVSTMDSQHLALDLTSSQEITYRRILSFQQALFHRHRTSIHILLSSPRLDNLVSQPVLLGCGSFCLIILVTLSECFQVASTSCVGIPKTNLSILCVVQAGERIDYILYNLNHTINESGTQSLFLIQVLSSDDATCIDTNKLAS